MRQTNAESLMEGAYLKLRDMLFQQEIVPGQKLIYRELTELLKVSSTPIQLALGRLEQEGFVERIPHVGFYVKRLNMKERDDLYDLRRIIEISAVELAIKNKNPQDVKLLETISDRHVNYLPPVYDRKKYLLDIEFHKHICVMSQNEQYLNQLMRIFDHLYLRSRLNLVSPSRFLVTASQHQEIIKWIKEGNAPRARRSMDKHIRGAQKSNKLLFS
jgi:DNA-binding GntR family transcriptional regulator